MSGLTDTGRVSRAVDRATDMVRAGYARISDERARLVMREMFFGVLAGRLKVTSRPDVETMATDGIHLFFAPAYVSTLTDDELLGVVLHEILHCAMQHFARIGDRDLPEFNVAADLAINPIIVDMGYVLPAGALLETRFRNLSAEEIYDIRAAEKRAQQQAQQAGQSGKSGQRGKDSAGQPGKPDDTGQPGQSGQPSGDSNSGQNPSGQPGNDTSGQPSGDSGQSAGQPGQSGTDAGQPDGTGQQSGQSGAPDGTGQSGQDMPGQSGNAAGGAASGQSGQPMGQPGQAGQPSAAETNGMGGIMRPEVATDSDVRDLAEQWETWTRQAASVAGKMPGQIAGLAKRIVSEIGKSEIDVRRELNDFIDSRVATDESWNMPNRRFVHSGMFLPGSTFDGIEHLVFAVDTSGSIDLKKLQNASAAIIDAVDSGKVRKLTILSADTRVRHVQEFVAGDRVTVDDIDLRGGGGTRFDDSFQWIADNADDATAIIYLTDMECDHWGIEPDRVPVLWAIHGDSRDYEKLASRAPFGECIYVGQLER